MDVEEGRLAVALGIAAVLPVVVVFLVLALTGCVGSRFADVHCEPAESDSGSEEVQ